MTSFSLGGDGGNSFSFGPQGSQPGAHIGGTVLDMQEVQKTDFDTKKPEFWDDGKPKMQYRVTLQTELRDPNNPSDDGKRDLYLDGRRRPNDNGTKSRLCAVLDAVRETTGGTDLQYGGKLTVQWISGMGFSGDPRHYQAWYEAPSMSLEQPAEHRSAAAAPPTQPAFGSPAHQSQVGAPPAWAQQQAPGMPPATQPAAPPAAQQAPIAPPATAAPEQPAAPAPAGNAITPTQVAGVQAAGLDPAAVFGPDWQQRVTA